MIAFKNKNIVEFLKFSIIGVSNTAIALIIYYGLVFLEVNYLIANTIGWMISVFNAYYWNNMLVFESQKSKCSLIIKTYLSYGFSFILSCLVLYILVEYLRVSKTLAPFWTLIITVPINFLLNKFWTFK